MSTAIMNNKYRQLLEAKGIIVSDKTRYTRNEIALLFPGHGSQYDNMFQALKNNIPQIQHILDNADRIYQSLSGEPLICQWSAPRLNDATVLQPSLFTADMAMYAFLESQGISGKCFLGHSLGEISALCASGSISFEDGLTICYYRAKALDDLPLKMSGKMVSVQGNQDEVFMRDFLSQNPNSTVSIINAPNQYVISGPDAEINALITLCNKYNVVHSQLTIPYPFHSPLLKPASEAFFNHIKDIEFKPNKISVYSMILERFYAPSDFYGTNIATVLAAQLTMPFSFVNGIKHIYQKGVKVFIECGPNNVLTRLVEKIIDNSPGLVMYTNSSRESELMSIAKLQAKYILNVNTNEQGERSMSTILIDSIATTTGYPETIISKHITNCSSGRYTQELAINQHTENEIILRLAKNIPGLKGSNLNSVIKSMMAYSRHDQTIVSVAKNSVTIEAIIEYLKSVISQKTGYPIELLDNKADLEADLGIDSVKQAEILGRIREYYGYELDPDVKIKDYPNINMIAQYVVSKVNVYSDGEKNNSDVGEVICSIPEPDEYITLRYSASAMPAALENEVHYDLKNKRILIVADQLSGDLTNNIADALKRNNSVMVIGGSGQYSADFTDPICLTDTFTTAIHDMGGVDCVINLQALSKAHQLNDYRSVQEFEEAYKRVYNGLFYSAKICYPHFESNSNSSYFAVTNIGHYFGVESNQIGNSLGAVTTGFLKALEKELRPFITKAIDIDLSSMPNNTASELLRKEFSHYSKHLEIGYVEDVRKRIVTMEDPVPQENVKVVPLFQPGDALLVTGGGRGITYECVKALLETVAAPIHVYLTGRTPAPNGNEAWFTMSDAELLAYKPTFMTEMNKTNPDLKVLEILQEFNKLKNARELFMNLQALEHGRHTVEYVVCDFSNEADIKNLSNTIAQSGRKIVGIINGAGLPSFGKVPSKNEEAAYKVLQLKANSMYFLNKYFLSRHTKFLINMGSISGRFGMDGQVDYSAAADMLVKLSKEITENTGCRCITLGWPAWDSVGMAASDEVMKVQKEERGLSYISIPEGCAQFLKEVYSVDNSKCEYLYFGNLGELNMPSGQLEYDEFDTNYPLIDEVVFHNNTSIVIKRKLAPRTDQHLEEHKVDGHSVLAGVYHIEMVCEIFKLFASLYDKAFEVSEISNYSFYEFIKYFDGNPLTVFAYGDVIRETEDELVMNVQLKSDFINKNGDVLRKDRLHSEGMIVGKKSNSKAPDVSKVQQSQVKTSTMKEVDICKYYELGDKLIHFGENFRNLRNVFIDPDYDYIIGDVTVTNEGLVFGMPDGINSIICPIVIDNIGRLMLLNEFDKYGYSIVPTNIHGAWKVREFHVGETLHVKCDKVAEMTNNVSYDATAYDDNGNAVFIIKKMTLTRIGKIGGDHNLKI